MAFERAKLRRLRKFNASALIRGGLALGLKRRADEGGCGGISRPSPFLPSTPLTAESAALARESPGCVWAQDTVCAESPGCVWAQDTVCAESPGCVWAQDTVCAESPGCVWVYIDGGGGSKVVAVKQAGVIYGKQVWSGWGLVLGGEARASFRLLETNHPGHPITRAIPSPGRSVAATGWRGFDGRPEGMAWI
jgi:hypothetical protein